MITRRVLGKRTIYVFALILLPAFVSRSPAIDEFTDTVDLSDISGPFSFSRFSRLQTGETWIVGGDGSVHHFSNKQEEVNRISDSSLNGVHFVTSQLGWVIGDRGTVLHTTDGGQHWKEQTSTVTSDLTSITCVGLDQCWCVGHNGVIITTVDRGLQWRQLRSNTLANLNAAYFVDSDNGWVVGDNGLVLVTQDGEQWKSQHAEITLFPDGAFRKPTDLRAVMFVDKTTGWVAGTGGIARTVDGGKTWNATAIDDAFIGIVMTDSRRGIAIGNRATNYKTTDGGETWCPSKRPTPTN